MTRIRAFIRFPLEFSTQALQRGQYRGWLQAAVTIKSLTFPCGEILDEAAASCRSTARSGLGLSTHQVGISSVVPAHLRHIARGKASDVARRSRCELQCSVPAAGGPQHACPFVAHAYVHRPKLTLLIGRETRLVHRITPNTLAVTPAQ